MKNIFKTTYAHYRDTERFSEEYKILVPEAYKNYSAFKTLTTKAYAEEVCNNNYVEINRTVYATTTTTKYTQTMTFTHLRKLIIRIPVFPLCSILEQAAAQSFSRRITAKTCFSAHIL